MKKHEESFDDIVFENRNKEYGAYNLRKRYSKTGSVALFISMMILFIGVGAPLIASILNKEFTGSVGPKDVIGVFEKIDDNKEIPKLPEPPPAKTDVTELRNLPPIISDSVSADEQFLTTDERIIGANKNPIDTTSNYVEIIPDTDPNLIDETPIENTPLLSEVPEFPGGEVALNNFLAKSTIYPTTAIDLEIQGTVYIKFVVTKNGKIGEIKVLRSVDKLLDEEAVRVVQSLPQWKPGKLNGNVVNVWFIVPIKFKLNK